MSSDRFLCAFVLAAAALFPCGACGRSKPSPDAGAGAAMRAPPRPPWARPAAARGEIPLDVGKSRLALTIIKDRDVKNPVTAALTPRDGAVALDAATARLSIDLDTFDSQVPLRNERVRGIFFETATLGFETAELTLAHLPSDAVAALRGGQRVSRAKLDATIKVHGRTTTAPLTVDAGYGDGGALWVKSAEPVEIKISDLGLADNLRRLSSICMHDSIDDVVKIDVSLEFTPR